MENKIFVTRSSLPEFEEYCKEIKPIWESHWLTNMGPEHKKLQEELKSYLDVDKIDLLTNGHMSLELSMQALGLKGEVITTPFTFASTTHAIVRNGLTPVFCDINKDDFTIDTSKIESLITDKTCAIVPVHVYGNVCNIEEIARIANKYGLKVIYDAAHAFGVEVDGKSVLNAGDMSTLSFHATKVYNTLEGGALVMHDEETKKRIDYLKNFGFANEVEVVAPGINSKVDEVRCAFGLLNLKQVDQAIANRQKVAQRYRDALRGVPGVRFFDDMPGVRHNYSYFPIFINAEEFGKTRDQLYFEMKEKNVLGRRYFYPLISTFSTYRGLPSAAPENLPVATKIANEVICLPMHHLLSEDDIQRVINCISK